MTERSVLPHAVVVLVDALRPVSRRTAARLSSVPLKRNQVDDLGEFLADHMRRLEDDVENLVDEFTIELGRTVSGDVEDAEVWRAVARTEVRIERILDDYDDVRRTKAHADDELALALLRDTYRDLIGQIQAWMNDILEVGDDPIAALQERGLPTEGNVQLDIELTLEAPEQLERLERWAAQRTEELAAVEERRSRKTDWGVVGLVLAVFGLGWILGDDE